MVYVISQDGKPLMPCSNPIARLLLKQGKAKVKKREPFTIKLTYEAPNYTQDLTLGVDTVTYPIYPKPRLMAMNAVYPHA